MIYWEVGPKHAEYDVRRSPKLDFQHLHYHCQLLIIMIYII